MRLRVKRFILISSTSSTKKVNQSTKEMAKAFLVKVINRQVQMPQSVDAFYLEPPRVILTPHSAITEHHVITTAICWTLGGLPPSIKRKVIIIPEDMKTALDQATYSELSDQVIVFLGMISLMTFGTARSKGSAVKLEYFLNRWRVLCTTMGIEDIFATNKIPRKDVARFIRLLESWQLWAKSQINMCSHLLEMAIQEPDTNSPELMKQALVQVKMDFQYFGLNPFTLMDEFINCRSQAMLLPAIAQQAVDLRKIINELKSTLGKRYKYINIIDPKKAQRLNCKNYPDLYFASLSAVYHAKSLKMNNCIMQIQTTISKELIKSKVNRRFFTIEVFNKGIDKKTRENLQYLLGIKPRHIHMRKKDENKSILQKK